MRFLLVEDRGDYTTNYTRKFADKDHQPIIQNLSKTLSGSELMQIKRELETPEKKYDDLNDTQRKEFILNCIKKASNTQTLSQARLGVVNAIKNSRWDKDVVNYLSNLPNNIKISDPIVELTSNLILDNKLNYNKNKNWINNKSIYDRKEDDTLTTIKALTLVNNPNLQGTETGDLFGRKLTTDDFKEGDTFYNAAKIQDILNDNVNPKATLAQPQKKRGGAREEIKQKLKDSGIKKSDTEIDSVIDSQEELVKNDLVSALTGLGVDKKSATKLVNDNYTNEKTFEDLLRDMLRGLGRGA